MSDGTGHWEGKSGRNWAWRQRVSHPVAVPQLAIGASVTLADGVTVISSGEVYPAIVTVTLSAPPATSGTALSTVAANTAKTFVDGSGNVLMWDGLIPFPCVGLP